MTTSSYLPSFKDTREGRSPGLGISIGSDRVTFSWFEDRKDLESSSPLNFLTTWPKDETSSRRDSSWGERSIVEDWILFWYIFLFFSKKRSLIVFQDESLGLLLQSKSKNPSVEEQRLCLPKLKEGSSRNRYIYIQGKELLAADPDRREEREQLTDREWSRVEAELKLQLFSICRKKETETSGTFYSHNILSHFGFTSFICRSCF